MTFRANMTSFINGISAVDPLVWRNCDGMVMDLWRAEARLGGGGWYMSPDPRIVIPLDAEAGGMELSLSGDFAALIPGSEICYVPARLPLWSRVTRDAGFRHLDLHFDALRLERLVGGHDLAEALKVFAHAPHTANSRDIARILAEECAFPSRPDSFVEALAHALLCEMFDLGAPRASAPRGGLAPWQIRRITETVDAHLHRRLSIAELAEAAGLSESWFYAAFRRTMGETPYRWQLRIRVERAREMVLEPGASLANVANATGFADQAHLTRAFRAMIGTTPAALRRASALTRQAKAAQAGSQ